MDKNIRVNHMVENSNKNGQNFLDMKKQLNNLTQGVVWAPPTAKKNRQSDVQVGYVEFSNLLFF